MMVIKIGWGHSVPFAFLIMLLGTACASSGERAESTNPTSTIDSEKEGAKETTTAPTATCYEGTSEITLSTGQIFPGGTTWVKRTVDPENSRIVEDLVAQGEEGIERFHVIMQVTDNTFTMTEENQAFKGDGTLSGTAWDWFAWESESVLPDGTVVKSTDKLNQGTGGFVVDKEIYSPSGEMTVTIHEIFQVSDCQTFDAQ